MWLNDIYQSLNPVALQFGPVSIKWYALAYIAGFVCAGAVLYNTARRWQLALSPDSLITIINAAVIGVIVGGRLAYVLFYAGTYYFEHPVEILFLSQGGMSFHGGLIGALAMGCVACRYLHFRPLSVIDMAVIGAPIGLFFGRVANFVNGELWGKPTDAAWGVIFARTGGGMVARHPSQLYEALLEGVVIFAVLFWLSRSRTMSKRMYEGSYTGLFLLIYGIVRFLIEFVRLPDVQLGYLLGTSWLTMGQVLSLPVIVAGAGLCIYSLKKKRQHSLV